MKCPVCKEEVNEGENSCPHCKIIFTDFDDKIDNEEDKIAKGRTNADWLNSIANINLIISIIVSIITWVEFFDTTINWWGVVVIGAILLSGVTLFFLLKTVVDIYNKVKK